MSDFQKNLEKYAELAVKVGVNIQKGQTLAVMLPWMLQSLSALLLKVHTKLVPKMLLSIGMMILSQKQSMI